MNNRFMAPKSHTSIDQSYYGKVLLSQRVPQVWLDLIGSYVPIQHPAGFSLLLGRMRNEKQEVLHIKKNKIHA
jgi:hypothetical protein